MRPIDGVARSLLPRRPCWAWHRNFALLLATGVLLNFASPAAWAEAAAYISPSLNESPHTAKELQLDSAIDAVQLLKFADIRRGSDVMDVSPHGVYFTRLFATAVGTAGHVYDFVPSEADVYLKRLYPNGLPLLDPDHANVTNIHTALSGLVAPQYLDVVWSFRNYHDFHTKFFGPADMRKVNAAIYNALKPGGLYIVVDNEAAAGSGTRDCESLHRIDELTVKAEVLASGFRFVGKSELLRNRADNRMTKVSDGGPASSADIFILKFQKPKIWGKQAGTLQGL